MNIDPHAQELLRTRYFRRDGTGRVVEDADGLFRRVASAIAEVEPQDRAQWAETFHELLRGLYFLPNSPTLMNAGLPDGQLSACFALPVPDSLEGIFESLKQAAIIHQSGGGTGFNFSALRPAGDPIHGGQGLAPGPLAFLKVFDCATEEIKQGGRRRGANMGILNIEHPDVEAFVRAKQEEGTLANFNLSVGITDAFMQAVQRKSTWTLRSPRDGRGVKTIDANRLWEAICRSAWSCGDPGLVFLDAINRSNPLPELGALSCTNPCGELPLFPYESCNLGSLNLSRMLTTGIDRVVRIDWDLLKDCISKAVRFLDNVISANAYLLPQTKAITLGNRKIGLGLMGWGESLIRLGIPYASKEAVALAERLMEFVRAQSYRESEVLGGLRGCYPNAQGGAAKGATCRRNATCNSIAPTGSISLIAGTSYSIEPLYALAYYRVGVLDGKRQFVEETAAVELLKSQGLWNPEVADSLRSSGKLDASLKVPASIRRLLQTAHEIPWEFHLRHQQAFQRHTDNAVSKTINLPAETPWQSISDLYIRAWEMGLKGVTVFRDGCKQGQVLQHCRKPLSCPL